MRRMVSTVATVAIVLLTAVASFAQEATTVLINVPVSQRDAGFHPTPSTVLGPEVQTVLFRLHIPTAEYEDTLNEVRLWLEYLHPVTSAWTSLSRNVPMAIWKGGRYVDDDGTVNPPVTMEPSVAQLRGLTLRANFEVVRRMRIGCTIETIP